ncbi:hypothetical protein PDTK01_01400 [Phycicoccus sp. DTK01]|nr:hypothetical protein [Phycicoccus sp. DTK01]GIL34063.1 hypothetical protein PDTK01_01400 [Phycicoccus sp. DTK01]
MLVATSSGVSPSPVTRSSTSRTADCARWSTTRSSGFGAAPSTVVPNCSGSGASFVYSTVYSPTGWVSSTTPPEVTCHVPGANGAPTGLAGRATCGGATDEESTSMRSVVRLTSGAAPAPGSWPSGGT